MPLTVIDPRSLDQTGDYTVNNITATGVATLSGPANLNIGGGTTNQVLSTNGSGVLSWITAAGGGGGGGVTSYALEANLPAVATNGDLGYVTGTQKMYLYNGTIWVLVFTATTPNLAPAITAGPDAGYLLSTIGTPIVITMAAQDPESVPITWSYTITAGNLGSVATIAQNTNVFTITPSTNTANGGSFELTITASDGVNLANARTNFRLRFTVEEPVYGLNLKSSIAPPTAVFVNSTNLGFGQVIAANGGVLAVLGYGVSATGTRDTTKSSVYIYTTLAGVDPVYQTKIDLPTDSTYTSSQVNKMCVTSNMLIVPGRDNVAGNLAARKWYVYFKTNDTTWTLTQTIDHGSNSAANTIPSIMGISSTGLVFACASQAFKTEIYTRDTTATTTWTLRQTILNADIPSTLASNDLFPRAIDISASGRHIAFSGKDPDCVSPAIADAGKVVIFTNTTYSSGGYAWGATFTYAPTTATTSLSVTTSSKYDDIFYVYRRATNDDSLRCLKYTSASNTWSNNTYDPVQVGKFLTVTDSVTSTWVTNLHPKLITAFEGPSESMSFLVVKRDVVNSNSAALTLLKFVAADLSINNLNNKLVTSWNPSNASQTVTLNNAFYWNAASEIPNPGNQTLGVNLCIDDLAGEVFLAAPITNWGGITSSGVIHRYNLTASVAQATTKTYLSVTVGTNILTIPDQCHYMSAVIVGGGGGGCYSATTSDSGSGGAGGALVAFSNYPVTPGLTLTATTGAGGLGSTTRTTGSIGGTSQINYNSSQAAWLATGGRGGPTAGQSVGGTPTAPTLSPTPLYYSVLLGTGGQGGSGNSSGTTYGCGGGGAGGYGSSGGAGQSGATALNAGAGNNGGGAGGSGNPGNSGQRGGGVGIYGVGTAGTAALGQAGGDGSIDAGLPGNAYGGGGGGNGWANSGAGQTGTVGAVRIIFSSAPIYTFGSSASSTTNLVRVPTYTGL